MKRYFSTIRAPVKRHGAENYLLLTLLSFALSISLTRLFLYLTGYPQLGGGTLHIAHVLWGGLLLFISALLPLIFANRWVYTLGAILAGVGVGLFIDEVGKFITQNNNYFYPPAAPLIYAFFLLTVLLYFQLRRPPPRSARNELYHSLDALEEVLDRDLDAQERSELEARLERIENEADDPDQARLAKELLHFILSKRIYIAPSHLSWLERIEEKLQVFETRYIDRARFKAVITIGIGVMGVVALFSLIQLLLARLTPGFLERTLPGLVGVDSSDSAISLFWFAARAALETIAGLLLIVACGLLATGRERRGITFSYFALLFSLTTVDLLVFYIEQFSTIVTAFIQFGLLLGVLYYKRHFL